MNRRIGRTALLALLLGAAALAAPQDKPPPLGERALWTTSRLTGSPEAPPPFQAVRLFPKLTFKSPVQLVPFPGHRRYALVEEKGSLFSFPNDPACEKAELLIDLRKEIRHLDRIEGCRGVGSSFALAFDPDFAKNRRCYVMYYLASKDRKKPLENGSRVSRFKVTDTDPPRIDPDSEEVLITWVAEGHNGCDLEFGNDGYLYISTGDAESPSPPDRRLTGQDVSDLMSSILRIDVRKAGAGLPYSIPPDNPFVKLPGARPEVWCYGLRNPWRMNFDRKTGRLWIADVGWERWEMVFAGESGGNFGWSMVEGPQPCLPDQKRGPTPILPPAHAIPHPVATSITGGFVYHGSRLKGYEGWYFYGDWETRRVWANPVRGNTLGDRKEVARTPLRIVDFAEDADGELLLVDYENGGIHRLEPNDAAARNADFPLALSKTGLFSSLAEQVPAPGVIPTSINAAAWADGATAQRWLAVPGRETIRLVDKNQDWPKESVWPKDSVVAKTLSLDRRKLETQVLHFDGHSWNGYSYVWNEGQTDAQLAPAEGAEIDLGGGRRWKISARGTCLTCHNPWPGYSLTVNPAQLDRSHRYGEVSSNELRALQDWGILARDLPRSKPLVDPYDESAPLDARARSYLSVNCAHCHRFGGGGAAKINLLHDIPLGETGLAGVRPVLGGFDLTDPYLVSGHDPSRSVLLFRVSKLGQGRMPHVGSEVVDEQGARLMRRWIATLAEAPAEAAALAARAEDRKALDRLRAGEAAALDRLLASPTGALDLLEAVESLSEASRKEAIRRALERPSGMVRDLFERFEPPGLRKERLGTSIKPEKILGLKGDAGRGRDLFASPGLQCVKCHRMDSGPEKLGADLSKIAAKYNRAQLLESILEPSKVIDPKYVGYTVQTTSGEVLSGIVVSKTETELVLRDAEKEIRLKAAAVERMVPQQKSLMPEGLLQHLTAQEAADLLAYLETLK